MLLRKEFASAVAFYYFLSVSKGQLLTGFLSGFFDGWTVKPLQFPYHALIGCVNNDGTVQWICNGAIINNRFVATSASCVYNCNSFKIRVGTIVHGDLNITEGAPSEYITHPGTKPYYAPGFVPGNKEHDLALLETNETIIYTHSVGQVILPKYNESSLAPNVQVVATGFGQPHKFNPWWELQFLTLSTMSTTECLHFFPNAAGNTTICATGTDYNRTVRGSLCKEFGAPLVLKRDNRTLIGIYQYSREKCNEGGPEAFVKIEYYIQWICETARFSTLESNIYRILKTN